LHIKFGGGAALRYDTEFTEMMGLSFFIFFMNETSVKMSSLQFVTFFKNLSTVSKPHIGSTRIMLLRMGPKSMLPMFDNNITA
jgi:hypothetical protein